MFKSLASAMLMVFLLAASANAVIIDTFDTGQVLSADSGAPIDSSVVSGAGILGTERDMVLDWFSGSVVALEANPSASPGLLDFSIPAASSGQGMVVWDGVDGAAGVLNPTGLGGIDLTEGGTLDRITIGVRADDLPVHLLLQVYTNATDWSAALLPLPGLIFPPGATYEVLFSDFSPQTALSGVGADFSNVGAIVLIIDDQFPATDLQIDFIRSTPEPATLSLLLAGGLVLIRRRRA